MKVFKVQHLKLFFARVHLFFCARSFCPLNQWSRHVHSYKGRAIGQPSSHKFNGRPEAITRCIYWEYKGGGAERVQVLQAGKEKWSADVPGLVFGADSVYDGYVSQATIKRYFAADDFHTKSTVSQELLQRPTMDSFDRNVLRRTVIDINAKKRLLSKWVESINYYMRILLPSYQPYGRNV